RYRCRPFRPGPPCPAWLCGEEPGPAVLAFETGPGPAAAEAAASWLMGRPEVGGVLAAGFCGALRPGLGAGGLVLATEVVDLGGDRWPATWQTPDEGGEGVVFHRGPVLTAGLVTDPGEKRRLGAAHGALAVDMESAAVARLCRERGVPFGCLRAVS